MPKTKSASPEALPREELPAGLPAEEEAPEEERRGRPWWATLLLWLGMVALIVALIVGGMVWVMYRSVTEEALPDRAAAFAGQTLSPAEWDWQVPVAGVVKRVFAGSDEAADGAALAEVRVSDPALTLPKGMTGELVIRDAEGEVLFEGDGEAYAAFRFASDGAYTAELTVTQAPPEVGQGVTGRDVYRFAFTLNAEPQVALSAESVVQGGVLGIRVTGVLGEAPPSLNTELGEAVFIKRNGAWMAYLGVPHDCPGGEYILHIGAGEYRLEPTVRVYGREVRELETFTADGTAAAPFIAAVPSALDEVMDIVDPDVYWAQDGFVQPVRGTLARDYDVYEYIDRVQADPLLMATYPIELQAVLQAQIDAINEAIVPRHSVNVTFSLPAGSTVVSPAAGRVVFAGTVGSTGRTLVIEHGAGLKSLFYLLGSIKVSEGDYVTQGQTVATSQGHIVCDMRLGGAALDPWSVWRNMNPGLLFE